MIDADYTYAVITNNISQFRAWKHDTFEKSRSGSSDFIHKGIRYIGVTKEDHCRGWHFNGIIIPDYVDQQTNKLKIILRTIDYCFRTK
jgi:hypothetical protein